MWHDRMGPVVIERCKQCNGVFFDGGEFETLRRGRTPVGLQRSLHAEEPMDVLSVVAEVAHWTAHIALAD